MKKIKVHLKEKLQRGTLLWINAENNKVYRSSKRFDTASFKDHDSNYMGKPEKVFTRTEVQQIFDKLNHVDRMYGVCLQKDTTTPAVEDMLSDKVIFFSTWENMIAYANNYVVTLDEAIARKEAMKKKWLEKGKRYVREREKSTENQGI